MPSLSCNPTKVFSAVALLFCLFSQASLAQISIFAHNDYQKPKPFEEAYESKAEYIEADVFLVSGELMVAHEEKEIVAARTLENLYLLPLSQKVAANGGFAYPQHSRSLTLMIDLKTEGAASVAKLVEQLAKYPNLMSCRNLSITVSGNMPDPVLWKDIPKIISFDGRPKIQYTPEQLKRVRLFSDSFANYSTWRGEGAVPEHDAERLKVYITYARGYSKPVRFWGAPDGPNAWKTLMALGVDVINTDKISEASAVVRAR